MIKCSKCSRFLDTSGELERGICQVCFSIQEIKQPDLKSIEEENEGYQTSQPQEIINPEPSNKEIFKENEEKLSEDEIKEEITDKEKYFEILKLELENTKLYGCIKDNLKNQEGYFIEVWNDRVQKILSIISYVKNNPERYKEAWECWAAEQNEKNKDKIKENSKVKLEKHNILNEYLGLVKDKKYSEASELLVQLILDNFNIYTTKDDIKTEVWIYKEGIYIPQGKSEIKKYLRDFLGKFYSQFVFGLVMNKLEPDTFIDTDVFFNQKYLNEIPVMNGLLNIQTKELKPFGPEKIFFNKLPVFYDEKAECPKIDKFLSDVLSNQDDRKVFYELGGSILLKDYKYEKAFMFHGDGRNGKDKTLELLKRAFGVENCCSIPLNSIVPNNFIVSELFGKMINIAGELNNNDLKDTSMFKALTGRSLVSAPRKFLRPITFQNYAKFIFACNELPMVFDNSNGFWSRWELFDFPYTFVEQEEINQAKDKTNLKLKDPDIIEKITTPDEMSGLLNKFLDGFDRLTIQKGFSSSKGCEKIKSLWVRKSNSVMAFCMDSVEDSYDSVISKKDFRKKYTDFCKQHNINPKTDFIIKKTLQEMFGASEDRRETLGFREFIWTGIKFKDIIINFSKEDILKSAPEFQEALKNLM